MSRLSRRGGPAGAGGRRGFTFVEVLVVLVVLGIVGTAVSAMLTRQMRFYREAGEVVTVRRELRTGASLLPSDARAISTVGGDVLAMQPHRFAFRATIGSAVVCEKGVTTLDLPPTNLAYHTLTSWYTMPRAGDTLFVFDEGPLAGAEDDSWKPFEVGTIGPNNSACGGAPFTDPTADPPATKLRWRVTLAGGAAVPADVRVGAVIRFTRRVQYRLYQPSGSSGWYLGYQEQAGDGWSAAEAVSGPYMAPASGGDAPSFRYFGGDGTELASSAPGTALTRVDVALRARADRAHTQERRGVPMQDSLLFRIGVRNFK